MFLVATVSAFISMSQGLASALDQCKSATAKFLLHLTSLHYFYGHLMHKATYTTMCQTFGILPQEHSGFAVWTYEMGAIFRLDKISSCPMGFHGRSLLPRLFPA